MRGKKSADDKAEIDYRPCCDPAEAERSVRLTHRPFKNAHALIDHGGGHTLYYATEKAAHTAAVIMNSLYEQYPWQRQGAAKTGALAPSTALTSAEVLVPDYFDTRTVDA